MARYEHLKVFKDCYDLTLEMVKVSRDFPKMFKYTLGGKIQEDLFAVLSLIQQANSAREKEPFQSAGILKMELLKIQIRLAKDLQCFSQDKYLVFIAEVESILRQLEGWKGAPPNK